MKLSVRADTKRLERKLNHLARQQLPKATADALNETAVRVKDAEMTEVLRKLDRPTPQTVNAFAIMRANHRKAGRLNSVVLLKDYAKYLEGQIEGGVETKPKATPGRGARLNAYGNLPRRATKAKNVFHMTTKAGFSGYFKPVGGKKNRRLLLVAHFPKSRTYRKRLDFYGVAERAAQRYFSRLLVKHLQSAIATSR